MFVLDAEKCTKCDECRDICPCGAIEPNERGDYRIIEDMCAECGVCVEVCEYGCITEQEIPVSQI